MIIKIGIVILITVIQVWPVGVLLGKVLVRWENELKPGELTRGLDKAGFWIGSLERILILIFVLANQFTGVGFLIAAKSIFRFGESNNRNARKLAEYFLIGTLLSFTVAILFSILAKYLVSIF